MAVLAIVRRDLVRFVRSPGRTALLLAVPLALAGMFTLVFGGSGPQEIVIRVLILNEDEGPLGRLLSAAGSRPPEGGARLELVEVGEEGLEMIGRGEASALVRVPSGFSEDLLAGRPTRLEVVKNPAELFLPVVVEEGAGVLASVLSQGSHVLRPELDRIQAMSERDRGPELVEVTTLSELFYRRVESAQRYLFPPVITFDATAEEGGEVEGAPAPRVSVLTAVLPGLVVMGVFFFAQAVTRDLLREREAGLLRHLLTAPVTVSGYLGGKCLSTVVACVAGFVILLAVGAAAGVSWGSPVALTALVLAISIAVSGTMLVISSLVRTERQGDALGTIVIMVWSMLGGAFVPLGSMPAALRPLSMTTLTYWGVDGLGRMAAEGAGLVALLPNLAILTGAGGLLLAVGVVGLRRRILAGGA